MGGSISVVIRKSDGFTHKLTGWTNVMPYITNTPYILDENHPNFVEFIEDYEQEDDHNRLSPYGYGLIVIDYKTKNILQFDSYYTIGEIFWASIENDIVYAKRFPDQENDYRNHYNNFCLFAKEKRVKKFLIWDKKNKKYAEYPTNELNGDLYENALKKAIQDAVKKDLDFRLVYDLSPFHVQKFTILSDMKQKLVELGFMFTEQEEKDWTDYEKGHQVSE